jgi:hypothetical protein
VEPTDREHPLFEAVARFFALAAIAPGTQPPATVDTEDVSFVQKRGRARPVSGTNGLHRRRPDGMVLGGGTSRSGDDHPSPT